MLQRQIMFKQLQELQRQQQLQGFGDSRQQNFVNQQSLVNKKVSGGQISPLINGTPICDPTQMFMFDSMNFGQHASSVGQGFPNELVFSQGQSQAPRSMGLVSQQSEMSSYGTNLAPTGNNLSHFSHLQVMSVKDNSNQAEKNLIGQVFSQGLDTGVQAVNAQQVNNLQRNASSQPFGGRPEQDGWHELFSGKSTNVGPSQGLSSLDPLEQKILFNMDDNSWDASFGKHDGMRIGGFDETYENTDSLGAFPSLQSGSWSALMQSAVAEASSSDTGLEEEWSGLSFQNSELSTDYQPSKFVETGKQPANWLNNNFQNASTPTSEPGNLFTNSNSSSTFPGFQHSRFQQKEDMRSDSSHESTQQSPKKAAEWLGHSVQHKQFIEESESFRRLSPLPSAWVEQSVECSERDAHNMSAYHSTAGVEPESYRQIPDNRQLDGSNYVDTSVKEMKQECMNNDHSQLCNSPRGSKGLVGVYDFSGNASSSAVDFEKGCLTGHQGNFNASKEASPRIDVGSGVSAFNGRSAVFHASHITDQTSENMLELLNKVDNSTAYRAGMHFGSSDSTLISEPPQAGNSDASAAQLYNQASASQYFGLRLAPPTQKPGASNYVDSPRIPRHSINILNENSKAVLQGPQYGRNQLQNQFSGKTHQSQQVTLSDTGSRFPVVTSANSEETSHLISTDPHHLQFANNGPKSTFQPPSASAMSQQLTRSPNVWIDVSSQENTSPMEVRKFPFGLLTPPDATKSGLATALGAIQEIDHRVYFTRENNLHHIGASAMNSQGFDDVGDQPGKERSGKILDTDSQEQKPVAGYPSEANAVAYGSMITSTHQDGSDKELYSGSQAPAISVKDLEAFGLSLKHSRVPSQQYSLLNQLHTVKNEETYIPLGSANPQLNSSLKAFPESLIQDACQETLASIRDDSQSRSVHNILITNETPRSRINFPFSSSIKNYGTSKDGHKFPIYEAANSAAQQSSVRKPFESFQVNGPPVQMSFTGASQASGVVSATSVDSATVKHLSSPFIQNLDVNDQHMVALRPKKRKFSTFEVLPWHKEVTQGSFRLEHLSSCSVADLEWAEAVNRLPEKLKDDVGMAERLLLFARPKKRLMMTTQLMQQLFRPAPAVICLGDATLNCVIMTFFVSRLALGDACSLASHYSDMPCEGSDLFPGKRSTSRSISDQKFSKIVENFFNWSKRLEGEFFRLEKGGSILDMKVEFQDLEKFALINRFAKFHIRGQVSSVETTPSATTSNVLKVFPQRYVIAVPMPKTVPEEAECISL